MPWENENKGGGVGGRLPGKYPAEGGCLYCALLKLCIGQWLFSANRP
jgi:hypothetical protein